MHKSRDKIIKEFKSLGFGVLLGSYIVLAVIFLSAYFNPERIIGLRINRYGEAHFEFLIFIVSIPAVFYYIKENRK